MIDISRIDIKTQRLEIRPLKEEDFPSFMLYVPHHPEADARRMLDSTLESKDTVGLFLNGELAGAILFHRQKDDSVYLGYSVRKDLRNRGIMTEAVKVVSNHLFHQQGIAVIHTEIDETNKASRAVMEKSGFTERETKDSKTTFVLRKPEPIYIVAGDEMLKIFSVMYPERKAIPFREDFSQGTYHGYRFNDEFIKNRADGFGVSPESYRENLRPIMDLDFSQEYVLCFGEDECCRANLQFLISYLKENGYPYPIRVMIVDELTLAVIRQYDI